MISETEVIACPACRHLVRVPLDWLGTQVQCPECQALFRAPVRVDGQLTAAELVSRPLSTANTPRPNKPDVMLLLPTFGLLVCGVAGIIVNVWTIYAMSTHPGGAHGWAKDQLPYLRKIGLGEGTPPDQQAEQDEQDADQIARLHRWLIPASLVASVITLLGGLAIAFRRYYTLARLACVVASVNLAHGCCIPGALAGLWGLLMLNSEEGREHFGI
jgi:hypothetical protein